VPPSAGSSSALTGRRAADKKTPAEPDDLVITDRFRPAMWLCRWAVIVCVPGVALNHNPGRPGRADHRIPPSLRVPARPCSGVLAGLLCPANKASARVGRRAKQAAADRGLGTEQQSLVRCGGSRHPWFRSRCGRVPPRLPCRAIDRIPVSAPRSRRDRHQPTDCSQRAQRDATPD